nr:hypothetical protein [Tanacetum cinerariifolium]
SDAKSESFSPPPILVKDSDSLIKEIDLFCTPDYPMPPSIMDKDYDSERDILIPKDLPRNNTLSFAEKESFHFDIPLFSHPPAKPSDGDIGILNIKMIGLVVQYSRIYEDSRQWILYSSIHYLLCLTWESRERILKKDKIEPKPDKNGKRGEAEKSQK